MTQVSDIMSKDFIWVTPETTLQEAARLMRDNDIGFLPVGENDRLIGMITDRDIAVRAVAEGYHPQSDTVRAVMTAKTYYCFEDQNVSEICDNMAYIKVRRLPVVDRKKRLVGIVSISDLARACGKAQLGETIRQITNPPSVSARQAAA